MLVTPGYLAGATGADPVGPLLEAAPDWARTLLGADVYYTSGCQRLRAARRDGAWTFLYSADPLGMPVWAVHCTRTTPDEVLDAFTRVLLDGLDVHLIPHLKDSRGQSPAGVFHEHGWRPVHGSRPWHTLSPDQRAALHIAIGPSDTANELQNRSAATWRISAGPDPTIHPSWTAFFTGHTPQALMTAVARAVVDPTPVVRDAHHVPRSHRTLVTLSPGPTKPPAGHPRPDRAPVPAPSAGPPAPAPAPRRH